MTCSNTCCGDLHELIVLVGSDQLLLLNLMSALDNTASVVDRNCLAVKVLPTSISTIAQDPTGLELTTILFSSVRMNSVRTQLSLCGQGAQMPISNSEFHNSSQLCCNAVYDWRFKG